MSYSNGNSRATKARRIQSCFMVFSLIFRYSYAYSRSSDNGMDRRQFLALTPVGASPFLLPHASSAAAPPESTRRSSSIISPPDQPLPFSSQRKYKTIILPGNSLPVLLVSDKSALQCQAALTIEAGQFYDTLPGIAHLMEHMVLSYEQDASGNGKSRRKQDFEDWLGDRDGASNAFTANQKVCFHFTCPKQFFHDALKRFSNHFRTENVEAVCRNPAILKREVRRVDSELDFDSVFSQEEHLTKAFVNVEHPYSIFSKGSLESLESTPRKRGIDVGEALVRFFRRFYRSKRATLVLLGQESLEFLESYAEQFDGVLSTLNESSESRNYFPGRFLQISRKYKHVLLFRDEDNEVPSGTERLSLQWVLDLDYRDKTRLITIQEVAFVVCQILERRGPGSLYQFLRNRQWINEGGTPKISVPVDVSGFQILKLEVILTQQGFVHRSRVIMAVFDSINTLRRGSSFVLARELISQYANIAKLFGYTLAPRPPDAIELSFDALVYGVDAVGSGEWYRFPEDRNGLGLNPLRRAVMNTLAHMSDYENLLCITTADESSLNTIGSSFQSLRWSREPVSGGAFRFDERFNFWFSEDNFLVSKLGNKDDELTAPVFNSLVPGRSLLPFGSTITNREQQRPMLEIPSGWTIWVLGRQQRGLALPTQPPEANYGRSAFVFQFLSSAPARANVRRSAYGELWKLCFEDELNDIGAIGAPGGLAYEVSFNQFGLRLSFLGMCTTLPSYIRRVMRRLAIFDQKPIVVEKATRSLAIRTATRARGLSPIRRRLVVSNLRAAKDEQVKEESRRFLESVTHVICWSQGTPTQQETQDAARDVENLLKSTLPNVRESEQRSAIPNLTDLTYKPTWRPRFASGCYVPGVPLMSDACGRVKR